MEGFSPDDYKNLLHLVYLGNWMVNAIRHPSDEVEEYKQTKSKVLAQAEKFGMGKYAEYDQQADYYFASYELSEDPEVQRMRDEYDDEVFWGELVIRLTRRDFIQKYGKKKIEEMSAEERFEKETEIENKYWREFRENGLERLRVSK